MTRNAFSGPGWDGMWLDMSEIVRPTRDGIHGREHIATTVELGARPSYLRFDSDGRPCGQLPSVVEITVPYVFDATGVPDHVAAILAHAARQVGTLAVVPGRSRAPARSSPPGNVVPLVGANRVRLWGLKL
jgi:hypothetical protein